MPYFAENAPGAAGAAVVYSPAVFELQLLRPDHKDAVRSFELANRAFFARTISDRGDEFFADFDERYRALLAEQAAGSGIFYVLVDENGEVVGRFNLYEPSEGSADVGYRIAERVAGRGVATQALRDLVRIAADRHGLRELGAVTSRENVASQRVLTKAGFVLLGPATVAGRAGFRYALDLERPPGA